MITNIKSSHELLELLLGGYLMDEDDINDLVNRPRIKEDLHIEYKHGDELEKEGQKPRKTIREYMSAFANSEGGILIIGIDAPSALPKEVTGCKPKSYDLAEWASSCLQEIAMHFSPIPKFHTVPHSKGKILIGVVARSLAMVPCIDAGKLVYHIRMHDQTLPAPEYLIADILLGRRKRPYFDVKSGQVLNFSSAKVDDETMLTNLRFDLRISFENTNIVWAEDSRWGIVAYLRQREITGYQSSKASQSFLTFVNVINNSNTENIGPQELVHYRSEAVIDKPFDANSMVVSFSIPFRQGGDFLAYTWRSAFYLTSKDNIPVWYQIDLIVNENIDLLISKKAMLTNGEQQFSITKMENALPIVAWDGL